MSVLLTVSNTLEEEALASAIQADVCISAVTSKSKGCITPELLAKNWRISLDAAKKTIKVTTKRGIRTVSSPSYLGRRYRTNDRQLWYRRIGEKMFTDTMFASTPSHHRLNKCAQVFGMPNGWTRAYPMKTRAEAHHALGTLFAEEGVPNQMVMDGANEQIMGEFRRKCREADCHIRQIEPHSPWSNHAKVSIRELKMGVARMMIQNNTPLKLWDHCLEFQAHIRSHTAHPLYSLQGQVPETMVKGEAADISAIAQFGWFDWVFFCNTPLSFPENPMVLGRYLGPSTSVGPAMCSKLLKANGQVLPRSTVRALTPDELSNPIVQQQMKAFDEQVAAKLGDPSSPADFDTDDKQFVTPEFEPYEDDEKGEEALPASVPNADADDVGVWDGYLNAEVVLPHGGANQSGKVRERAKEPDGSLTGKSNPNPILDTRVYVVEFPDRQEAEFTANAIAEAMYSQCDMEGNPYLLMESISDHKMLEADCDTSNL